MKSAMDAPDVAPGFTAVELLIPTWCTCWDKQSIIHDNLIVIKYLVGLDRHRLRHRQGQSDAALYTNFDG